MYLRAIQVESVWIEKQLHKVNMEFFSTFRAGSENVLIGDFDSGVIIGFKIKHKKYSFRVDRAVIFCLTFMFDLHRLRNYVEASFDMRAFRTLHNSPLFSRYTSVRSCTLPQRFHA